MDLFALPLTGQKTSIPVAVGPYDEREGQLSPDGRWIAYQSNESGRFEIYVQSFPGPGTKTPVSVNGGAQVRWRGDGKELFFVSPDDRMMSVRVDVRADGTMEAGAPAPLFGARLTSGGPGFRQKYDVSRDGQRFLLNSLTNDVTTTPITLLLNWHAASAPAR
jgi:hypothetical protein